MEKITNKEKGERVREKINNNFAVVSKHLNQNVLSLSTSERISLSEQYLSIGLRVYDATLEEWFRYTNTGWEQCEAEKSFSLLFSNESWSDGIISIPYSSHKISNPYVQLYILIEEDVYDIVVGGFSIDGLNNITLHSDMPFSGKVVIK